MPVKVTGPKGGLIARHIPAAKLGRLIPGWLRRYKRVTLTPVPAPPAPKTEFAMFDSVTVSEIPADAAAVAGYVNGSWPTFPTLAKSHPHARRLSIAVSTHADADCLDVEKGDATPDEAPAWVRRQLGRGVHRPVVYTFLAQAQTLVNTLERAGIKRGQYALWVAHWTYHPHRCTAACGLGFRDHADATQWTDKAHGRNLDQSLCAPDFLSAVKP